ncbi:MAG: phosphoenolpyruvate--protein phosphotransferase [Planctomycetes bacterium]|nr:phosphoenolpyruvate--protein phosphotransferase [Planctomycetota bacterium]
MRRLRGSVVSEGLARGEALVVATGEVYVPEGRVAEAMVEREVQRFDRAVAATRRDIEVLRNEARQHLGEMTEIIGTYLAFLGDEATLLGPVRRLVREERYNATYATFRRFSDVSRELEGLPEPLPSRVPDLVDIKRRIIGHLRGGRGPVAELERLRRKVVIIADDLSPTQTAKLDRDKVLAFVTDRGGPASHTAILARHLGIPAVVGLGNVTKAVRSGDHVIVDGMLGEVIVTPDDESVRQFQSKSRKLAASRKKVHLGHGVAHTRDRTEIRILGNIDRGEQVPALQELGIEGVGLFRTEFLFLGRRMPDEEEQRLHYGRLLADMAPHPICIRTMDFGADKWDHRVGGQHEENPFLGMRAIRLSFAHETLFRTQLRAILRASPAGNCRIMFPMIMDVGEFRRAVGILRSVQDELRAEGQAYDPNTKIGAMIEVPSAALTVENLLREVDFLSLGTNDLTQYTLAVDRTNPLVANLFDPHHPSVLRLISDTSEACLRVGCPLSACGEMAGTSDYTPVLIGLGLTTLSMASRRVPLVVPRIAKLHLAECRDLAQAMLAADDAAHARRLLDDFHRKASTRSRR